MTQHATTDDDMSKQVSGREPNGSPDTVDPLGSDHDAIAEADAAEPADVLVIDDPHSLTAKSQKARTYGIRMLTVPVFLALARRSDKQ